MERHSWISLIVGSIGISLVMALWLVSQGVEMQRVRSQTSVTAQQVELRLESCINARAALVSSLASIDWLDSAELISEWTSKAEPLYRLYPGIQALSYIDNRWVIRVTFPVEGNEAAKGKDLHFHSSRNVTKSLARAEQQNAVVSTDVLELLQSGKGFALYQRIQSRDGETLGFVNGVFRLSDLIETCLSEKDLRDRFRFLLYDHDGSLVFGGSGLEDDLPWRNEIQTEVEFLDRVWLMKFSVTPEYLELLKNPVDEMLAVFGVLLILLIAWLLRTLLLRQKTLEQSQLKYRMLVENQTDFLINISIEGRYLYVSPNLARLLGKTEAALTGSEVSLLVHDDDKTMLNQVVKELKAPPYKSYMELRGETVNGWRWLAWSNSAVLGRDGRIESVMSVGRDITEIKQLEAQISHASKMETMGRMAGGISHDFNNLLHVMLGNLEFVIGEMVAGSTHHEDLKNVEISIRRAMSLAEKLATLSRQEAFNPELINLSDAVEALTGRLRKFLTGDIELHVKVANQGVYANADVEQLEQVLLNLCINARDAIEKSGNIKISVSTVSSDSISIRHHPDLIPGGYGLIEVEDDGCGVESASLTRVFDPFYTTKDKGMGTGLGLANCYSMVKQHKGLILVESSLNQGTTFSVYLPLVREDIEPRKRKSLAEDGDQASPSPLTGKQILIVDDEPQILILLRRILEADGVKVFQADNGEEALNVINERWPELDLVILDLVMPVMDGRSAGIEIKACYPELPILYATGYDPGRADSDKPPLNDMFIRKPFSSAKLLKRIRLSIASRPVS